MILRFTGCATYAVRVALIFMSSTSVHVDCICGSKLAISSRELDWLSQIRDQRRERRIVIAVVGMASNYMMRCRGTCILNFSHCPAIGTQYTVYSICNPGWFCRNECLPQYAILPQHRPIVVATVHKEFIHFTIVLVFVVIQLLCWSGRI